MVPYGPISEKWSRTHIYKKIMVQWVVRSGPNSYLNVDTYYWRIQSISHRPSISAQNRSKSTVDVDSYQKKNRSISSEKSGKKGPLTYGPIWSHKWWEIVPDTHLQKSHGPMGGEKWSQQLFKCRYLSTDLSTQSIDHRRYRRSIRIHLLENTVDIDSRCRFTYGELRSIVDGRLKIEIILWSISSTTPVNDLYWRCTSFEKAFRRGRPLNILHDS